MSDGLKWMLAQEISVTVKFVWAESHFGVNHSFKSFIRCYQNNCPPATKSFADSENLSILKRAHLKNKGLNGVMNVLLWVNYTTKYRCADFVSSDQT